MKLLLLRHGATAGNLKGQYIGSTDEPLAPLGIEQARARAPQLPPVEALWVSPLRRAQETAALFYPDLPQRVLTGLREMDFGLHEGKTWAEINDPSVYDGYLSGDPNACFPQGERLGDFARRTAEALKQIAAEARTEALSTGAIVAHGGVLMMLMSLYGRPPRASFFDWGSDNCGGFLTELSLNSLVLELIAPIGGKL